MSSVMTYSGDDLSDSGSGSQAADALLLEGASGCVKTWHRRCTVLSHCSSHIGAVKCGCGQPGPGSHSSAAAALRMTDTLYHAP